MLSPLLPLCPFSFSPLNFMDEVFELDEDEELSLLETLDHVLDHGLVIAGEMTIAVADVDLIYLGLNLLVGSVETVNRVLGERERRAEFPRGRALARPEKATEEGEGTGEGG